MSPMNQDYKTLLDTITQSQSSQPINPLQLQSGAQSYPAPINLQVEVSHHLQQLSNLIQPLLAQCGEVEKLRKEVELWRDEWGKVEGERKRLEGVLAKGSNGSSLVDLGDGGFTAVLLDGDGLIFQDHLVSNGYQGGLQAAKTLLTAIPGLTAQTNGDGNGIDQAGRATSTSVIVQVFVNKSGLANTLIKAGSVVSWAMYDSFWQGFSAAHDLFTVIDVGNGKEASDAKIREYLRLYAKNAQCHTIVLGASHDNGYANVLSSLQTESRLSKVLILKGYSDIAPQLRQYSSRIVTIPDLFCNERLSIITPATPISTAKTPYKTPLKYKAHAPSESAPSEPTSEVEVIDWEDMATPTASSNKAPDTKPWKVKDGKKGKKSFKDVISKQEKEVAGSSKWEEAKGARYKPGKGVDVKSIRKLDPRPCHTYYLSQWGCKAGDSCDYGHDYKFNDKQLEELARLAKEVVCPYIKAERCNFTAEDCVYGHQCPRMEECGFGETCRFSILANGHGELDGVAEDMGGLHM